MSDDEVYRFSYVYSTWYTYYKEDPKSLIIRATALMSDTEEIVLVNYRVTP